MAIFHRGRPRAARRCRASSASGHRCRPRSSCSTPRRSPAAAASFPGGVPEGAGLPARSPRPTAPAAEAERVPGRAGRGGRRTARSDRTPRATGRAVEALWRWRSGARVRVARAPRRQWSPRTSSSRSTGRGGDGRRRSRSAPARAGRALASAMPATGTSTRASSSRRSSRTSSRRAGLAVEELFDARRSRWAARSRASTASGCSSAASWRGSGRRGRSSCTARSSALFDPKNLLNPGKKLAGPLAAGERLKLTTRS